MGRCSRPVSKSLIPWRSPAQGVLFTLPVIPVLQNYTPPEGAAFTLGLDGESHAYFGRMTKARELFMFSPRRA
jgi:hypothetical protein